MVADILGGKLLLKNPETVGRFCNRYIYLLLRLLGDSATATSCCELRAA